MSQPANDVFSQHLSDDEASYHEDASNNEGGNGNSKKRISTGKDGVVRVLPPVSAAEIHAVEKERKARTILLMAIPKEHLRRFHGMDDAKEIWEAIRTRSNVNTGSFNINTVKAKQPINTSNSNSSSPDHPLKNMEDRGIFDSGCSGHMTGNKDHLDDFKECKGGSVTFGGSKGYITGKGRIRVGNLDFDSMSFVKELGHFNLFSISQICDKQHKVLFTKTGVKK
ncbi:hypothetical protein Tco_0842853 [Tanacetum coccineum]|uniref:Retrovirus-related Pol polyprotein from transposon TNT 1-94-like beta-barrel domain-containing protein n=1 Tax=Tanacetum coccineum TaxID=301880 RepID=A0ABQ5B0D7_9ASTR